jgi:hypothetical protein
MATEEALEKLKAILGKGLYPNAIPQVEKILKKLEQESFEAGYEQARDTVGDWYEPEYPGNEGYD